MVICKFYLQGNCKFGDRCFKEHSGGGGGGYIDNEQSYRQGGRQQDERHLVQPNKFSFNRVYDQTNQRGAGLSQQQSTGGSSFSFNKALHSVSRPVSYQEPDLRNNLPHRQVTFGQAQAQYQDQGQDLRNNIDSNRHVRFNHQYQQQQQYETPKSTNNQYSRSYSNLQQPQKPAGGFSFNQLLSQAKRQDSQSAFFGGSNLPVQSQTAFGRGLISYEDIDMDGMPTQASQAAGIFNQQVSQQTVATAQPQSVSSGPRNDDYSEATDLTQEAIVAFKADRFIFGMIPLLPPMKEVC